MSKEDSPAEPRKPYLTPVLTRHGSLATLTTGGSMGQKEMTPADATDGAKMV